MFFKIYVLKNVANFTRKHLYWSLFLINLQAFGPTTLLKRDSNTGVFFSVKFAKCLRASFLQNTSGRLLLNLPNWVLKVKSNDTPDTQGYQKA